MKNNKKPIFTVLKIAGGTGLAVVAVFAIIITLLLNFSQPFIQNLLHEAGFPAARIGSFHADLSGIRIEDLRLDDNGNHIGLIEAGISLKDLLAMKLNRLTVKDASIDLSLFLAPQGEQTDAGLSLALPQLNIPARNLNISNLTLKLPLAESFALFIINGQGSDKDAMSLTLDGTIESARQSLTGKMTAKAVIDFAKNQASVDLLTASFKTAELSIAEGKGHIDVYLTDKPVMEGSLQLDGITYTPEDGKAITTPLRLSLSAQPLSSDAAMTGITGTLTDQNGLLNIKISGRHDIGANNGQVDLHMPPTAFTKDVYQLSDAVPAADAYAQNVTGSLGATVNAQWHKKEDKWALSAKGTVFLKDVDATVKDLSITKINAVTVFESLIPPVLKKQSIAIGGFDSGLPLTNGVMVLSLDAKSRLTLHAARWDLARGTVTSSPFTVSLKDPIADVTLTATALDLSELFKIAPLEGLSAIGRVNGMLPIKIRSGKMSLVDGVLETEGNGRLSYDPAEVPAFLKDDSNSAIVNVRTALKAFSFDNLKIMLNGDLGGQQKIMLRISGNNPDFYDGHPVNLNLNVEGPLESILKYNPGGSTIPDSIRQQLESYESTHAEK